MGWVIALAVLVLLAVCPLGVGVEYGNEGLHVRLLTGPVKLRLYPAVKSQKKTGKQKKAPAQKTAVAPVKKWKAGSLTDFLPLVDTALDFLGDLRRKIRVNRLELLLVLAGGDPCDLGINYGKAWAVAGNLMPLLESVFVIKKRNMHVDCDFTQSQTQIFARADITITLGRLLSLAVMYGVRILREYMKIVNQRKGGAMK